MEAAAAAAAATAEVEGGSSTPRVSTHSATHSSSLLHSRAPARSSEFNEATAYGRHNQACEMLVVVVVVAVVEDDDVAPVSRRARF